MVNKLVLKIYRRVEEIGEPVWNKVAQEQPFGSYCWQQFSEKVMEDCQPLYILVFENAQPVGRATFYFVPTEPIPLRPVFVRQLVQKALQRWPLLICRMPLAGLSGVSLVDESQQERVTEAIMSAAFDQARKRAASFVLFDFVEPGLAHKLGLDSRFHSFELGEPGTEMELAAADFESYLASLGKEDRYHYRRVQRKAQELGIVVERHTSVAYLDEALPLIRNVETQHGAAPQPWTRALLENLALADATWLTARIAGKLVGCGLVLRDNGAQMNTALGLADDVQYVYFVLLYESLRLAFEHHIRRIRLGSGAYDVKRHLGLHLEENSRIMVASPNPVLQYLLNWMAKK